VVFNPFPSGTLKLLYGEAFRAPNVYEANYQNRLAGYKASSNLQRENIQTAEVVWEQRVSNNVVGSASFYDYVVDNLIDPKIDPSDSLIQFQNVSRVKARGLELELNVRLGRGFQGYANYILQEARDADLDQRLTNSPEHMLKWGLSFPITTLLYASTEMQYESERTTVYGTTLPAYFMANLNFRAKSLFDHFDFDLMIRNVLNTSYQTPGGIEHRQAGITQDGRNVGIRLGYSF